MHNGNELMVYLSISCLADLKNLIVPFSLGAGSVLETLQAGRPLIVVINELLMDNHQMELASQLAEDGHLCYATCRCGQMSGHMIYTTGLSVGV